MLNALQPLINISADGLPVDPALQKRARLAAKGYILLCIYYLIVVLVTLNRLPWASLEQVGGDLLDRSAAIVMLFGILTANVALAACAWHLFSMHRWLIGFIMSAAWAAAAWFVGIFSLSVSTWLSPETGHVGLWTIFASAFQLLIYASCAWLLLLVVITYSRQRKQALEQTTDPLPTATL